MSRRRCGRLAVCGAALALGATGWIGCNAIAGITDGQLAADSGSDVTVRDGPAGDGPVDGKPSGDGPASDASDGGAVHDGPEYSPPVETLVNVTDGAAPPDPHATPGLAVLPPTGSGTESTLVATFIDYDDTNFPSPHADSWAQSTNSGTTFSDNGDFPDPGASGFGDLGDPAIAADPVTGNVYVVTSGGMGFNFNAVAFLASGDRGVTFAPAVNAGDPSLPASDFTDVPSVAVDTASAQGQGRGDVYTAYVHFAATLDLHVSRYSGGMFTQSVAATRAMMDALEIPHVIVAPNRYIHVVYYSQVAMQPSVNIVTSRNQNGSWDPERTVAPLHVAFVSGDFYGELGINGTGPDGGATPVEMFASPQIVANPVSGDLYVVYADSTQGSDKANVYFTLSQDAGMSWSTPVKVNDDMTPNDQFLPAIAVSPDGKRLAVDFYDRRDDPNNVAAYRYGATADISGANVTFGPNFRVSSVSAPILVPFAPNSKKFSISTSMGADARYFYDLYADCRSGNSDVRLARFGVSY